TAAYSTYILRVAITINLLHGGVALSAPGQRPIPGRDRRNPIEVVGVNPIPAGGRIGGIVRCARDGVDLPAGVLRAGRRHVGFVVASARNDRARGSRSSEPLVGGVDFTDDSCVRPGRTGGGGRLGQGVERQLDVRVNGLHRRRRTLIVVPTTRPAGLSRDNRSIDRRT